MEKNRFLGDNPWLSKDVSARADQISMAELIHHQMATSGPMFPQHRGIKIFAELGRYTPMPIKDVPAVVARTYRNLDFYNPTKLDLTKTLRDTWNDSSLYNRAVTSALDSPESPEAATVFDTLSVEAQSMTEMFSKLSPSQIQVWHARVQYLSEAYIRVHHMRLFEERAFGEVSLTEGMLAFTSNLDTLARQAGVFIRELDISNLEWFIQLASAFDWKEDEHQFLTGGRIWKPAKKPSKKQQRPTYPAELFTLYNRAEKDATDSWRMDNHLDQMDYPIMTKWDEFESRWSLAQSIEAISTLARVSSDETLVRLMDIIDDSLDFRDSQSSNLTLSAPGLAVLMRYDFFRNIPDWAHLRFEENLPPARFGELEIPGEHAPKTTIKLLTQLVEHSEAKDALATLEQIQEQIARNRVRKGATMDDWLTILSFARASGGILASVTQDLIRQTSFPHQKYRQVMLDQEPGTVWLQPDGAIKVTGGNEPKSESIKLHTSRAVKESPQQVRQQKGFHLPPIPKTEYVSTIKEKQTVAKPKQLSVIDQVLAQPKTGETLSLKPNYTFGFEPGHSLETVGSALAPLDLEVVRQGLADHLATGVHRIESLRRKSSAGYNLAKMRINGLSSGIRVIFEIIDGERIITKIDFRKESTYDNI